jgi:UDP-N-acetylmuramoyl-tripeptide--D-alanyl-D-alanine ligase
VSAFTAGDALAWTGGRLRAGSPRAGFEGVSIDSRTLAPGALFVAIRGPAHDGHDYLAQALERGAAGVVAEIGRGVLPAAGSVPVLEVEDTTAALGALAAGDRARFRGPLVAITGSSGKTTTKEMCAAILGVSAPCLKTEGNLNNEYGLPLTLLRRRPEHASAVVELGMNHRGEIARLAAIARPTIGLVTNIGSAHIEHLGSREAIAEEKGDLFAALGPDAVAVVNADDACVVAQARRTRARRLSCAVARDADVRALDARFLDEGAFAFRLRAPEGEVAVRVAGLGETAVANATAAAAAALAAGAPLADVARGLAAFRPVRGRMEPRPAADGVLVIDDSYNANPQSLGASLEALARLPGGRRAVAVLGDMAELGDAADAAHREAGRRAAELGVTLLFALGERAELVAGGALAAGMPRERVRSERDCAALCAALRAALRPGDRVLVKGSRSMRMERVANALAGER